MRAAVEHAAAHDFAVGMQAVLIGMAAALVLAFVVALLHPGDRPAQDASTDLDHRRLSHPQEAAPMKTRLDRMLAVAATLAASAAVAAPAAASPRAGHPRAAVVTRIPVGTNPYQVAVARRLHEAFVVNRGSVSVVRMGSGRAVATIPTGNGDQQVTIALGNGGQRAYVGGPDSPYVSVVDTTRRKVVDNSVLVGNGTVAIATARTRPARGPTWRQLDYSRLGVLDTHAGQITDYLALPHGPQTVTTAPGGRHPRGSGAPTAARSGSSVRADRRSCARSA